MSSALQEAQGGGARRYGRTRPGRRQSTPWSASHLDYETVGDSMLMVAASGTAVTIE